MAHLHEIDWYTLMKLAGTFQMKSVNAQCELQKVIFYYNYGQLKSADAHPSNGLGQKRFWPSQTSLPIVHILYVHVKVFSFLNWR